MLADFFTKPLQGAQFKKFRDVILGYEHVDSLTRPSPPATTEERVGDQTGKRTDDGGSGVTDDEGFTLVATRRKKKNRTEELSYRSHEGVREHANQNEMKRSVKCFERSFSRNNPVYYL